MYGVKRSKFPACLFMVLIPILGFGQDKGDAMFSDILHEIRIESTDEPNLANDLIAEGSNANNLGNFPYHLVSVRIDGEAIDSVGVRVKGASSALANPTQKPLKLDLNKYISGQKYDGLKKINLHNGLLDEFLMKDRLAYEMYRRAGIAAPRTAYAEVYINDSFIGLYVMVEQVDDVFLAQNFATDKGSLIKNGIAIQNGDMKQGDPSVFDGFI